MYKEISSHASSVTETTGTVFLLMDKICCYGDNNKMTSFRLRFVSNKC